jgi:dihydrofolate reductase
LKEVPAHLEGAAEIIHGEPGEIVRALAERNVRNLYIDGGKTIQSFLAADLIDEMIVTVIAKIIGEGIPLFGRIRKESEFRVVGTEILNPYMVQNHFRRQRE